MKLVAMFLALMGALPCQAVHTVTIGPAYGYFDAADSKWKIPLHIWVHSPHDLGGSWSFELLNAVIVEVGHPTNDEKAEFTDRIAPFEDEAEDDETVEFVFSGEDRAKPRTLKTARGKTMRTNDRGVIEGVLQLTKDEGDALLKRQGDDWLKLDVLPGANRFGRHNKGSGEVRLITPGAETLGIISDIDDTVKLTGIPVGLKTVLKNTFFRPFMPAKGMLPQYQEWAEKKYSFHYVSGGFWPLQERLTEFLFSEAGFPKGSLHMRDLPRPRLGWRSFEHVRRILPNHERESATFRHKVDQIKKIMNSFPEKHFILVGDSGEKDPEIYRAIKDDEKLGHRVKRIIIREVSRSDEGRLEGMEVVRPSEQEEKDVKAGPEVK